MVGAIVALTTPASASAQPSAPGAPQTWQSGPPLGSPTVGGFSPAPMAPDAARWTTPAPARKSRMDPLMTAAWTELAVGGAFTIAGAIGLGLASRDRDVCGALTGCFAAQAPELGPLRFGAFSLGLGIGVVTSAGVTLIVGGLRPMRPEETRLNGPLGAIGHAALSLSIGLFAAGFAYGGVADYAGGEEYGLGWPAFMASGLLMATGIPMVVAGTQITDAEERGVKRARGQASIGPMELRFIGSPRRGAGTAVASWSWL